jgi:hypothetical protein
MDRSTLSSLTAGDAAVALRSLARRFRESFRPGELSGARDAVDISERPPGGGPSPLQLVQGAQRALASLQRATESTLDNDEPRLDPAVFDRASRDGVTGSGDPAAVGGGAGAEQAVASLADTAQRYADRVQRTPLEDWQRAATVGGERVAAIELVREAVASARTYLDRLGPTLDELRRSAG